MLISFQIAGIIIILVILAFYFSQKRLSLRTGKVFVVASLVVSVLLLLDIFSIYCIVHQEKFSIIFTNFLCKLYLVFLTFMSTLGFIYIVRDLYRYNKKIKDIHYVFLVSIIIISTILIFITGIEKYYDGKILYTYGPSTIVCYITCGLNLIATIVVTIIGKKEVAKSKSGTIIAWMIIWLIAAVTQFFVKELLIVSFASAIGLVIIYIMLENPALAIDKETGSFNSTIFDEYMTELFTNKKLFKLVYITLVDNDSKVEYKKNALIKLANILSSFEESRIFVGRNDFLAFKTEYGFAVVIRNSEINDFYNKFEPLLSEYNQKYKKAFKMNYLLFNNSDNLVSDFKAFKALLKEVLDNSDIVTYKNNKYTIDESTVKRIEDNIKMEGFIKNAIENDLIVVNYQPIYSKEKNKITSAEALVRIKDPNGALIYPNSFIELAEKNGLISKLGEKVFIHVCDFINKYNLNELGLEYIEVNLSVVQCGDEKLADRYIEIMKEYNINPKNINLEITETASTNLRNIMINNMKKLIDYGVSFSLDDFGMGNSNLNYIIEMPVEIVKFDRILVNSYFNDDKAKFVMTRIIEMIKALRLEIVLEGIETREMLDEVLKLDIDFIQGYYYSKPVSEIDFVKYVNEFNNK